MFVSYFSLSQFARVFFSLLMFVVNLLVKCVRKFASILFRLHPNCLSCLSGNLSLILIILSETCAHTAQYVPSLL